MKERVQTAEEFLAEQRELVQEAGTLLPGQIDVCSMARGYTRQQVFSCLTCRKDGESSPIGVCYGCFVSCHTDHEVVELDYKRSFRCDCGTSKAPNPCTLKKGGPFEDSTENQYNHNFDGRFCHCDLPFKEEVETADEETTMLQCLVCEDWFHDRCLSQVVLTV